MYFEQIVKTAHYKNEHEQAVPWDRVLQIIFTTKSRPIGKDLFEFKSESHYVLCKLEDLKLKVINAKVRE